MSSATRVSLVTESYYPAVDAATTTVKNVADRLIDTGHEVQIVAPGPGLTSYRRSPIARIRPLDQPGRQVHAALESFGPDLVHVTSPGRVGRKALKFAERLDVPTLTVQQSVVNDLTSEYWVRKVADRSDHLVVTCEWMQRRLTKLGLETPPLWVPGVGAAAFGPQLRDSYLHDKWSRRRSPGGPQVVVGYVGSLHKRNGVRRLAEAAQVPGVRLVVIGDGAQKPWLKDNLPEAKFLGKLETGELATAMASLDLLLHPGTEETDCLALREAMASGVPVIAPAAAGASDVIEHGVTGLLYDPAEDRGLRRAVALLSGDESKRRDMGAAARAAIEGRDWAIAADELIATHYPAAIGVHEAASPDPGAADLRIA
jgi:phosphatidylinositol alpha 1,6-mannosyltransferase